MSLRRDKAGIFVSEWRNFTPGTAKLAYDQGFRYVILQGHAGDHAPPVGHPSSDYIAGLRAIGFDVGCWGAFGSQQEADATDPTRAAQAANGIILHLGYSFYVANIEVRYDDAAFIAEFRKLLPKFTLWLSSEITNPRDWDAWFGAPGEPPKATAWLPQCYLNVNPNATPIQALFWATRTDGHGHGIPAGMVKPTIGLYDPRYPISEYVAALSETQQPGFSVWLGETAHPFEWRALGDGIRTRGIARVA